MRANKRAAILLLAVAVVAVGVAGGVPTGTPSEPPPEPLTSGARCAAGSAAAVPVAAVGRPDPGPPYEARVDTGAADVPWTIEYEGARLVVRRDAIAQQVSIGITPLSTAELPPLDTGMTNVTQGPRRGYRFTPHPFRFERQIQLEVPYDPGQVGGALSPEDVYTFYFDAAAACWRPLERVAVDERRHVVVSLTDHFNDMVNAVATPEHPAGASGASHLRAAGPGMRPRIDRRGYRGAPHGAGR